MNDSNSPVARNATEKLPEGAVTRVTLQSLGKFIFSVPKSRLAQLDFLRGVAILLVLRVHYQVSEGAGFLQPLDAFWAAVGWTGVDLFFVLSGFLVGGLLMQEYKQEGAINAKRFIIRRIFKIWPLYYAYLLFVLFRLVQRAHVPFLDALGQMWVNFAHIQNYLPVLKTTDGTELVFLGAPLLHTWTLAIEEHFYLLLPLLLVWLTGKGTANLRRYFPVITIGVVVFCLAMRLIHWFINAPTSAATHTDIWYFGTHLRVDSLFWGVALAYLFHLRQDIFQSLMRHPARVALLGWLCLIPFVFWTIQKSFVNTIVWPLMYPLLAFGFGCLLLVLVRNAQATHEYIERNPLTRAIAFIGVYSYPIYLWHWTFGQTLPKWFLRHSWFGEQLEIRWLIAMGLYIVGSTLVGLVIGRALERPFLILRDRIFPSRASGISSQSAVPQGGG